MRHYLENEDPVKGFNEGIFFLKITQDANWKIEGVKIESRKLFNNLEKS